jgi:hypothetical protein
MEYKTSFSAKDLFGLGQPRIMPLLLKYADHFSVSA